MRLASVSLRDFRNYERAELDLGERLTVVVGPNGAGKTNLLEAVYFACTGRSCRTSNERELVRHGASVTRVTADVQSDDGCHRLEVGFQPGEPKRMRVDGASVERLATSGARPLVSVFLPDRLELVKGAPALRRSHLDQFVTALWPARASTRMSYSKALAQRNALISRVRAGAAAPALLDTWDVELARHGVALMADRRGAADLLAPRFAERAGHLGLPEPAELRYRPRSKASDEEGLRAELLERRDDDLRRGFSAHGPHRDDLVLLHSDRSLRSYGSQGQQRVALLALLFAERDALVERDRPPLMLLDDVMSELDAVRRERLASLVREGGQAVITATEVEHVPGAGEPGVTVATVAAGTVEAVPASGALT